MLTSDKEKPTVNFDQETVAKFIIHSNIDYHLSDERY